MATANELNDKIKINLVTIKYQLLSVIVAARTDELVIHLLKLE
jgi:hypothetical protein